jgi:hypothetical protein
VTVGYMKGECSRTDLRYRRSGAAVTVFVSPAKGSYPGQVEQRSYLVELPGTDKPRSVIVNRQETVADYEESTRTVRVRLSSHSIRDAVTVSVSF